MHNADMRMPTTSCSQGRFLHDMFLHAVEGACSRRSRGSKTSMRFSLPNRQPINVWEKQHGAVPAQAASLAGASCIPLALRHVPHCPAAPVPTVLVDCDAQQRRALMDLLQR